MCMFCAAVPIAAAAGTSLDSKQRKHTQAQGHTPKRIRPFVVVTLVVIVLLIMCAVIIHTRFPRVWL